MPFFYLSTLRSFCLSATFHLWILTADDYGKEFVVNLFIIRWDNLGNLNNEIQMNCFLNQSNYFFMEDILIVDRSIEFWRFINIRHNDDIISNGNNFW